MIRVLSIIFFLSLSISLLGQKSKIIRSVDDLKTVNFGDHLEIIPFELKFDEETGTFIDLDRFDREVDEIYEALEKMFSNKEEKDDKFKKIRFLSANEIRKAFSVDENRKWAEMLGLEDCKSLKEPFLSKKIFEALNK